MSSYFWGSAPGVTRSLTPTDDPTGTQSEFYTSLNVLCGSFLNHLCAFLVFSCAESQSVPLYLDVNTSSFYTEFSLAQVISLILQHQSGVTETFIKQNAKFEELNEIHIFFVPVRGCHRLFKTLISCNCYCNCLLLWYTSKIRCIFKNTVCRNLHDCQMACQLSKQRVQIQANLISSVAVCILRFPNFTFLYIYMDL